MITLIAAMGRNREIGFKNQLLWNIPEDMKHFKEYTMGKVIVMGANTFTSIGSKALPGRKNIVVTRQHLHCLSAIPAPDIGQALSLERCYDEMVIIGGASIYRQTIDLADKLVITHVEAEFTADTYFPVIDSDTWTINSMVESKNDQYNYSFVEYIRNVPKRVDN